MGKRQLQTGGARTFLPAIRWVGAASRTTMRAISTKSRNGMALHDKR